MRREKRKRAAAFILAAVLLAGSRAGFSVSAAEAAQDPFTEEEKQYIAGCDRLKVGYVADRRPVSFRGENGELDGISRDIFDRISQISGLRFDYVELPSGAVTYEYLLQKGFDLVTSVEYNEENQKARGILISNPYLSSRKVIVAKHSLRFQQDADYTVAISTGSQTIKKVFAEYYPNFHLVDYPSIEACFNAVHQGEADLLIQNQYVAEYWLHKPVYGNLTAIPVMELDDRLCFSAVTPLDPSDSAVWDEKRMQIDIINKAIAMIQDSETAGYIIGGTMENMYQYTVGDFVYQYRHMLMLSGITIVVICVLLGINIHIRIRSIRDKADAKAKEDFLSAMSHEIRTPLNGLISLNYLMSRNVDDKEKITGYLKQSSSVARYLLALVNNVLDMSKLKGDQWELEQKPVNLKILLETVESVEKSGMENKGIRFQTELSLPYPGVLGDEVRIQQILVNLLDNACKYTPQGGSVTMKVGQTETDRGEIMTRAEIIDTGVGISEEFQKKIFAPFTQERNTVSQGNQGTGLGMAVCSLLAERMGGSLSVESKPGKGSRFTFLFTAKPAALQDETERLDGGEQTEPTGLPRVLIAEDNELNGQILVELLEGEGYSVLHVTDGRKAVETFEASAPGEYGVILMDLLMPEMNGFEAAKAIRSLRRPDAGTVRIIACTANTFQEDQDKALESGMDDFIGKPIHIDELLRKLAMP